MRIEQPEDPISLSDVAPPSSEPHRARPYGFIGLCLSLVAITLIASLYFILGLAVPVCVEGFLHGWEHWLDPIERLAAKATDPETKFTVNFSAGLILYLALTLAVLTMAWLKGRRDWRDLVGWHPWRLSASGWRSLFIAIAAILYGLVANGLLSYFYPEAKSWFEVPHEIVPAALLFVLAVILAPLTEELLFRGWIYTSLRASFGVAIGILISAAFFAAAHYEKTHIYALAVFPIGIALGTLRQTADSLKASIAFHAFFNAVAYVLAALQIG